LSPSGWQAYAAAQTSHNKQLAIAKTARRRLFPARGEESPRWAWEGWSSIAETSSGAFITSLRWPASDKGTGSLPAIPNLFQMLKGVSSSCRHAGQFPVSPDSIGFLRLRTAISTG
ncbi:MAG TPA: hypothetical protein VGH36_10065, partial [Acetobacteraceae bacterium]